MKKIIKPREKVRKHPVMTYIILTLIVIIISGVLSWINFSFTYSTINVGRLDYTYTTESITSLFNLSGLKYIFSSTVSNFASFTILSHLIIVLLGIGIMEYSGYLKTLVQICTKRMKKFTVTFIIVLICMLASILDNLPFIAFIPLVALIFKHAKRNPNLGIITSFAALTCGYGISLFFTSTDSALRTLTLNSASVLYPSYKFSQFSTMLIMGIAVLVLSIVITLISENYISRKLPKYEFSEEELSEENDKLTKPQLRGLIVSGFFTVIYLLIIFYNVIPGLPLSGNLLDNSATLYIDKLFGPSSFFANGFVFIVTMLFIIQGFFYGFHTKTIRNNREFIASLGYSLNGVGKTLIFIFAGATFISIFKQTNIGNVVVAGLTNLVTESGFTGIALVILLFIVSAIATIFVPSSVAKWTIMSSGVVPALLNVGLSAEFIQVIYRFGECMTLGITPLFSYFIVYLAYLEKYTEDDTGTDIHLFTAIRYQLPYSICTGGVLLVLIILWYLIGLPLGFGGYISV